jgi:hypothetical protein
MLVNKERNGKYKEYNIRKQSCKKEQKEKEKQRWGGGLERMEEVQTAQVKTNSERKKKQVK